MSIARSNCQNSAFELNDDVPPANCSPKESTRVNNKKNCRPRRMPIRSNPICLMVALTTGDTLSFCLQLGVHGQSMAVV